MKFERKTYKIVRYTKNNKEYYYNLIEDTDGLYAEEEQKDGSIQRTKIGNFFLRYIKVDNNDKEDSSSKILYYFQVYYINNEQLIVSEKHFCYKKGQLITARIESKFPYGSSLDSTTKETLDYFTGYLKKLIRNGVETGIYVKNEAIVQSAKKFLIQFVEFIQGRENLFLEMEFNYTNNISFYDKYNICDTKDLFIVNRTINERYKKIGFYYAKRNCYIIDLPKLRKLMLEECHEAITANQLNIGLKSLGLVTCKYCFKSTSRSYHANLVGLDIDKLIALAYPNGIPADAPIEEEPTSTEEDDSYNDDNYSYIYDDNNEDSSFYKEKPIPSKKLLKKLSKKSENKHFKESLKETGL